MGISKKKILISQELISTPVGNFFQTIGFGCDSEVQTDKMDEYCFIVNDYCPDILNIPRIKTDPSKTFTPDVEKSVRGSFDQKYIEDVQVQKLLKSFLSNEEEFSLINSYSNSFKNIISIKIHEYLNLGTFIDTVVIDAYKNKFENDLVRKYLNQLFEYAFAQVESQVSGAILEMAYSFSDDVFAVELVFNKESFDLKSNFNSQTEVFKNLYSKVNYLDVNYFKKRSRLTISSLWLKNQDTKKFKSYFFSEIDHKEKDIDTNTPLALGIEPKEDIAYKPQNNQEEIQAKKLSLARKFALFIKNYRKDEIEPKELMSLVLGDVDEYLTHYPRQEAVSEIDEEVRRFILKLLQDENLYNGISDYMTKIANSNLDPQVEQIQRILSGKTLDDLEEVIRIKGVTENLSEESTLVKGWLPENDDEEVRIKGVTDTVRNNEKWAVKRTEISEKIQEEITRIKSEGRNIFQDDIIRVVSKEVGADDPNVAIIIKDIVEEAISSELTKTSKLEEAFALKFISEQANIKDDGNKPKAEAQVLRMKKVIEQMKAEMLKLKEENVALKMEEKLQGLADTTSLEVINLKKALGNAIEINKNKEKISEKLKSDLDKVVKSKDEKIAMLETRIEQIKEDYSKSSEHANLERLEQLKAENKGLAVRLELANRKINIISDNMDKQDNEANAKKDKEIQTLKASMQLAQTFIEKYKIEKAELENKIILEQEKLIKLRDEKSSGALNAKDNEKDLALSNLVAEKKALEDKFKLHIMDSKKMEQKLKFTMAQLEDLQKKKSATSSTTSKGSEIYIKQLELANSKLADAANELSDKKKELHKLKQENGLLNTKLAELERKLNIADKKAS